MLLPNPLAVEFTGIRFSGDGRRRMLTPIVWTESFSVGHPALDREHQSIVEAINLICAANPESGASDIADLFQRLRSITRMHFAHETAILRAVAAGARPKTASAAYMQLTSRDLILAHIEDHDRNFDSLELLLGEDSARASNGRAFGEALQNWFVTHAIKHDAQLKTLFQAISSDCPEVLESLP